MTEQTEDTNLPDRMDFIGQRADVVSIRRATHADDEEDRVGDPPKVIEETTITCDECEGTGYIDEKGQIICEGCGMVLSSSAENTQYPDEDSSRGFEMRNDIENNHEGPDYER